MTKLGNINPVQTILKTPCFPTSQIRHATELSLCHVLQLNDYRQYNLAGKLCVAISTAADGETAGCVINDVTEVYNIEGKPDKFRSVPCDFQLKVFEDFFNTIYIYIYIARSFKFLYFTMSCAVSYHYKL